VVSPRKSYWHTLPGTLTAVAGVITAVTGLIVAVHQVGVFSRGDGRDASSEAQELRLVLRQMKEQLAIERAQLEALHARIERQPATARNPEFADLASRVGALNSSSGAPSPQVRGILLDPALGNEDKVILAITLMMKDLDGEIEEASRQLRGSSPSPTLDVETIKLKRLIDQRSQLFDQLRLIIDKYNQTARGIIDSIGR
jgi:hypothetical protein